MMSLSDKTKDYSKKFTVNSFYRLQYDSLDVIWLCKDITEEYIVLQIILSSNPKIKIGDTLDYEKWLWWLKHVKPFKV